MALDNFIGDPEFSKDGEYYVAKLGCFARIEYPGLHEELPRDIRKFLPPEAEYKQEVIPIEFPFWVEGRGYTREEAYDAAATKMNSVAEQKFDEKLAEVTNVGIRRGLDDISKEEME